MQNHDKFQQRYYEFLDYFRIPDGPIFLKICGEGPCSGISNDYLGVRSTISSIISEGMWFFVVVSSIFGVFQFRWRVY